MQPSSSMRLHPGVTNQINRTSASLRRLLKPSSTSPLDTLHHETQSLFSQQRTHDLETAASYLQLIDAIHAELTQSLALIVAREEQPLAESQQITRSIQVGSLRVTILLNCQPAQPRNCFIKFIFAEQLPPMRKVKSTPFALMIPIAGVDGFKQLQNRLVQLRHADFSKLTTFIAHTNEKYKAKVKDDMLEQKFYLCFLILSYLGTLVFLLPLYAGVITITNVTLGLIFGVCHIMFAIEDEHFIQGGNKLGYYFFDLTRKQRRTIESNLLAIFATLRCDLKLAQLGLGISQRELEDLIRHSGARPDQDKFTYRAADGKTYILDVFDVVAGDTLINCLRDIAQQHGNCVAGQLPEVLLYYLPPLGNKPQHGGMFKIFIGNLAIANLRQGYEPSTRRPYQQHHEIYLYSGEEILALLTDKAAVA